MVFIVWDRRSFLDVTSLRQHVCNINVTGPAARSSFLVQGEAGDCQGETLTMEYTIVSTKSSSCSVNFNVPRVVFKITTIDGIHNCLN